MADHDPTKPTQQDWVADLDAADAEIEAGLFVPGEDIQAKFQAALARMRSGTQPGTPPKAAQSR